MNRIIYMCGIVRHFVLNIIILYYFRILNIDFNRQHCATYYLVVL